MVRRLANEGHRESGESVKAPIVSLCRNSKDKLAATATLGLPLNSCTYSVHGWLCVSEEKGTAKQGFVWLLSISFFRESDDTVCLRCPSADCNYKALLSLLMSLC